MPASAEQVSALAPYERVATMAAAAAVDATVEAFLKSAQIKDIPLRRKGVVVIKHDESVLKALQVQSAAAAGGDGHGIRGPQG